MMADDGEPLEGENFVHQGVPELGGVVDVAGTRAFVSSSIASLTSPSISPSRSSKRRSLIHASSSFPPFLGEVVALIAPFLSSRCLARRSRLRPLLSFTGLMTLSSTFLYIDAFRSTFSSMRRMAPSTPSQTLLSTISNMRFCSLASHEKRSANLYKRQKRPS